MPNSLSHSINAQRAKLNDLLNQQLAELSTVLLAELDNQKGLDRQLAKLFQQLEHCKYVYALDTNGVQLSATINRYGADDEQIGRNRSNRPYLSHIHDESIDFKLSEAYISRNKKRPSVTAIQTIRDKQGVRKGFLGVDFDLRELPHSDVIYEEPSQWRQIKGDPAIRGGLFQQNRTESQMDMAIDNVISVHNALMRDQGVYHWKLHFSSSRSTIWHVDDPFVYRILTMDELSNTDICLAYPRRPYPERAVVTPPEIEKVLQQFKALRFADETIYLRSGSLNIINGKVGLNFSCDGTHYLNHNEFLEKGVVFWLGEERFPQATESADEIDLSVLDPVIEELAGEGCIQVNKLLYAVEQSQMPDVLKSYSASEREYIYQSLKSVMDVYESNDWELASNNA